LRPTIEPKAVKMSFLLAFLPFLRKNFGSASARALMTLTKSLMALSSSFIVSRGTDISSF